MPAGKQAVSITLPTQTGSPSSAGRIHVFAIATNGTRVPTTALTATAGARLSGTAGEEVSGTLATATGGTIGTGTTTATVNWGDGSPLEEATVTVTDGTATVTGAHTYATAGSREAVVTVDDGTGSASVRTPVEIAAAPVWTPTLTTSAGSGVRPRATVHVTGAGFAAGETVTVTVDGEGTGTTAVVAADGSVAFDVTAPGRPGSHSVSAIGDRSATLATVAFQVVVPGNGGGNGGGQRRRLRERGAATAAATATAAAPATGGPGHGGGHGSWAPEFRLLAEAGTEGTVVGYSGSRFAPNERVTLTLHSKPLALGTVTANADGVLSGTFTVPSAARPGAHEVQARGATSAVTVSAAFRVLARPAADAGRAPAEPGRWGGLASTGSDVDPARWGLVAGALVLLGAGITATAAVVRRRRSRLG
ncbi:hypothetical protein [Curtobacterium sp. MCJR17_043]|uniref:hypothetical protein n=1 Tax=Curtobacterium sp. MCJR17_043 TaxID=2175660 RepID=UPI0024DFB1FD|nr:hypothetical protein [Curtobacterium sp. MCJR17_043]WIB36341.1 hypothetical protein DEJ15_04060 [Curtobacterium sp. MCJR17_043]